MAENKVEIQFSAVIDALQTGLNNATSQVKNSADQMTSSFHDMAAKTQTSVAGMGDNIKGTFDKVTGAIATVKNAVGLLVAAFAVHEVKRVVDNYMAFVEQVHKLSEVFGMSTERATTYAIALKEIGLDADTYSMAFRRMVQHLKESPEAFERLGVKIKDSSGAMLSAEEVMRNVISRLGDFKEGIDRTEAASDLFGMRINSVHEFLRLTDERMVHAAETARRLGLTVGEDGVIQMHKYEESIADMKLAWTMAAGELSNRVLPAFIDFANWVRDHGGKAIEDFVNVIRDCFIVLKAFGDAIATTAKLIDNALALIVDSCVAVGRVLWDVFTLQWKKIGADAKLAIATLTSDFHDGMIQLVKDAERTMKDLDKIFNVPITSPVAKEGKPEGTVGYVPKPPKKEVTEKSEMAIFETQLLEKQRLLAEAAAAEGLYYEMSLAEERVYWEQILTASHLGENDKLAIQRKINELRLAELKAAHKNELKDEKDFWKAIEDINKAERERIKEQNRQNEEQYTEMTNTVKAVFAPFVQAFQTSINGMIMGTTTLRNALRNLGQSILAELVNSALKMLIDKVVAYISATWFNITASATQSAANISEAATVWGLVTAYWALVAAKIAAAVAGAAGGAAGGGYSAEGGYSSAQGGYDIPEDITMRVHKREMILPENLADRIRNMTEPSEGKTVHFTFAPKIHAFDSKDVERALLNSRSGVNKAWKRMTRDLNLAVSHGT